MVFSFSEKRNYLSNVQIVEWYHACRHLEAEKPGLLAKLEGVVGRRQINTKEIQGKSCALCWPNYKDLHYSQNQPAKSVISFCTGTKEKEKRKEANIFVNWLFR